MSKILRLTESELHNIILETVNEHLNSDDMITMYRGFDSDLGEQRNHLLWLCDDLEYVQENYGNAVKEYSIDLTHIVSDMTMEDIFYEELGDDFDYLDGISEEYVDYFNSKGIYGYSFYVNFGNSYCICLWNKNAIMK